ncbi:hypothetical protein [Paenibacillus sp. USHLN196]|uniref:hypothetical protein n=1 Tax=Paenibacillus sp. USHLN196 TaxID=3081291 RepID=UPI0030168AA3
MKSFGLTDNYSNYHVIESELPEEIFSDTLYAFNCKYYEEFQDGYANKEVRNEALNRLVSHIEAMGFKTRLIQPIAEYSMWVWD